MSADLLREGGEMDQITWKDRIWYITPMFNIAMMIANGEAGNTKLLVGLMIYNIALVLLMILLAL